MSDTGIIFSSVSFQEGTINIEQSAATLTNLVNSY